MGRWLRGPLRMLMEDTLSRHEILSAGIFSVDEVERLKQEHLSGRRKHSKLLFSLIMFQLWRSRAAQATQARALANFAA